MRVPKPVVDFVREQLLERFGKDEATYWSDAIISMVEADADDEGYLLGQGRAVLEEYGLTISDEHELIINEKRYRYENP